MVETIREVMESSPNLEIASIAFIELLKKIKKENHSARINFVSGIVRPNGPDFPSIEQNLQRLSVFVDKIRTGGKFGSYVFSAAELFNLPLYAKFDNSGATNINYMKFWRNTLRSRQVDNIHMTPLWERSEGSSAEDLLAKQLRLNSYSVYLENGIIRIVPMRINDPSMMPGGLTA